MAWSNSASVMPRDPAAARMSRQVVASSSIPPADRRALDRCSGSPGSRTSSNSGATRAARICALVASIPCGDRRGIAQAGQVDERGQHGVDHPAAVRLVGTLSATHRRRHDLAHHGQSGALVAAERQQRTGMVAHETGRIRGGVAGIVDQAALGHLHALVEGDAGLAGGNGGGRHVQQQGGAVGARHRRAERVGAEAALAARPGRLRRRVVGDVDEGGEGAAGPGGQLAIGADPPDMRGIAQRQHAGAQLLRAGDGAAHRVGRHALAVAAAGVDHQQSAGIQHRFRRLVGHQQPVVEQPHIGRQHADAVAVVTGQVGAHQVVGDFCGLVFFAAHPAGDQMGEGIEGLGGEGRHRAFRTIVGCDCIG